MKKTKFNSRGDSKNRRLSFRSETIAHLSTVQLTKVVGGNAVLTSWDDTICGNTSEGCIRPH
jgi:hypothetical protein